MLNLNDDGSEQEINRLKPLKVFVSNQRERTALEKRLLKVC